MAQAGLRRATLAGATSAALALTACAAPAPPVVNGGLGPPDRTAALPVGPIARAALEVRTQQVPVPPPTPYVRNDTCGAAALAWLIGRPRTEIPIPVDLSRRRVACTACPVAPEVRLDRLNILFDAQTDRVARLTCG